jgi:hypothetical protein
MSSVLAFTIGTGEIIGVLIIVILVLLAIFLARRA